MTTTGPNRRSVVAGLGAAVALSPARFAQAQTSEPIRLGMQVHRTGIGSSYGRWYGRVAEAALARINGEGGINGRPVEIMMEDDGTDPRRGAEVVEKLVTADGADLVFGPLFSNVVLGSAPRAGELKIPYVVCSEGYHVASGALNRYCFQPGISDVRAQVSSVAPWMMENLGRRVTMIYPDYAYGHDHRDFLTAAIEARGGEVAARIPIPPTESSFTRYFPRIPRDTEVLYHVMVGPAVLTFVQELGRFYGTGPRPELFGFIDSLEAVDLATPQLGFLEGSHFWEGHPRYVQGEADAIERAYREAVGVDGAGASVEDPRDVATYAHMFSTWESLHQIKRAMEASGYASRTSDETEALVLALEDLGTMERSLEHPQGEKIFVPEIHQSFAPQHISRVSGGRLDVVHRVEAEDTLYEPEADYTQMPL
jgi:branched-chain amino acid transport system substrate-binding protein